MRIKMDFVTRHGDGRLIFKRDIPEELQSVAGRTTWQKSLRSRDWNATVARLHRQYKVESDRALAGWREQSGATQSTPPIFLEFEMPEVPGLDPELSAAYFNSRIPGHDLRELKKDLVAAGVLPGRITTNRALVKLDAVVEQWATERDVRPATRSDMNTALRVFKAACGTKAIDEYDHDDARKAKAAVLAEQIKNGTKRKRWNMLSALFAFAKANRLVSVDVFRELRLELEDDSVERLDWTPEALNGLFATPVWAANERPIVGGGEAAWWLPVLSLLHGNRLSEFAQLRVSDVIYRGDHIGLSITDDGEGQHVKNSGSKREVPLHPAIREDFVRFLEWHKRECGDERLFPLVKPDKMKRSGGRFSTWFTKYRKDNGIYLYRQDAHSFRHTHITACRNAKIPTDIFSRWTGHTVSDVVQTYGDMSLAALAEEIGKVKFEGVAIPRWNPGNR
jgi:integrase